MIKWTNVECNSLWEYWKYINYGTEGKEHTKTIFVPQQSIGLSNLVLPIINDPVQGLRQSWNFFHWRNDELNLWHLHVLPLSYGQSFKVSLIATIRVSTGSQSSDLLFIVKSTSEVAQLILPNLSTIPFSHLVHYLFIDPISHFSMMAIKMANKYVRWHTIFGSKEYWRCATQQTETIGQYEKSRDGETGREATVAVSPTSKAEKQFRDWTVIQVTIWQPSKLNQGTLHQANKKATCL